MSRIDNLVSNYERFVKLPWQTALAPAQRVWMAVYPPSDERRLRLHLQAFETASQSAGHEWSLIDISSSFEEWMANHDYRDAYFADPELIEPELAGYLDWLITRIREQLESVSDSNTVVGLLGSGGLFGLGSKVKVSSLLEGIEASVAGRLLVFFPGEYENDNYRLLNGRDGWNYHAIPITTDEESFL